MNALLAAANALLGDAKAAITGQRKLPAAVVHELLDNAQELVAQARTEAREDRQDLVVAKAKMMIERELPQLETARRLLAYARDCGSRADINEAAATELLNLLDTAPQFDRAKGILALTATSEWLQSNRPRISTLLSKINTQPNTTR